jgi:hypothetical protein
MSEQPNTLDPAEAARSVLAWLAFFRRVVRRRMAIDGRSRWRRRWTVAAMVI